MLLEPIFPGLREERRVSLQSLFISVLALDAYVLMLSGQGLARHAWSVNFRQARSSLREGRDAAYCPKLMQGGLLSPEVYLQNWFSLTMEKNY